ncbi:MAG TPA: LamG domain-containing protein [Chthoniobacterales bacterium]|nr:LamG domain-containing protein [Chthoniobacterales bacterium]
MKTKLFFPALLSVLLAFVYVYNAAAQNCITPPSNMLVWLPGDANPQDILNNAMDVKVNGTVTFSPGMVGNAFTFNNSGDVTYSTINAGNNYTIDFWIRPFSSGKDRGRQAIIGNDFSDKFGNISLGFDQIEYTQAGASSILDHKVRSPKIPYDAWTHVALTYDGQVNRLFINGTLILNQPGGDNSVFGTSSVHSETFNNPIRLGQSIGTTGMANFDGQLDEVEIFNRVLSQAEIQAIVNASSAGKCKAPVDADGDGVVDGRDACPGTPPGTAVNGAGCSINACFAPPAGLNHWLPGDGNPQDILNNSDAVRVDGALTFAPGVVGQAFDFNGTNAITYSNMNVGNAYTVDFWVRQSSSGPVNARQNLVGNAFNGGNLFGFITVAHRRIEYSRNAATIMSGPEIPFDAYTHVALTYDGQVNRLYMDGNLVATSAVHTETFNNPLILAQADGIVGNNSFVGQLDEIEIFNRALTQTELRGIYNAAAAGKCKTLIDADGDGVVDRRDACPGTAAGTAVNASGCALETCFLPPAGMRNWFPGEGNGNDRWGGNHGTLSGGTTFAPGKVGQAFSFNDTGGVSYSNINAGNAYTVDFWVRPTGDPGVRREVISNNTSSQNFGLIVAVYNYIAYNKNGSDIVKSPEGSVPNNVFTHVTLTYDGQVSRLYINGNHVGTSGVHTETFNNPLRIGDFFQYIGNNRFIGQVDEVEIFDRALTQTEIRGIFDADTVGKCTNGVADKTLGNISTRLPVLSGENVLIGGLIVVGQTPKRVIIRALGPSLGAAGVAGALEDPTLQLFQGNTLLFENDNWKESQESEIAGTGVAPSDNREAAIVRTLQPGSYTAVLRGKDGTTGVALLESYDLEQRQDSKLANIATRGFVGSGDSVLIAGFIAGPQTRVVVRAIGPSLGALGIQGPLQDPTLQVVDAQGGIVRSNDDWEQSQGAEIQALGLQPADSHESALIENIAAGSYTAVVRGKNNSTGVAVVEVYNLE